MDKNNGINNGSGTGGGDIDPLEVIKYDLRKYPTRPYVGAGAVVIWDEKLLLMKRKYEPDANLWSIPWGHMLVGESSRECARRETLEKTGINIRIKDKVGFVEQVIWDEERKPMYHYILICYYAEVDEENFGEKLKSLPRSLPKTLDFRFVPPEELGNYEICGSTRELLKNPMLPL